MLSKIVGWMPESKNRDVAMVVGGMGSLLMGSKLAAVAMFAQGARGLERHWRAAHPEVAPGMKARFDAAIHFYESTHEDPTNRVLHMVGIPMIAGGALGLLATNRLNPIWWASAASFSAGWALNIVGHAVYEKKAPAFSEDPLSFIAGPVWDVRQLAAKLMSTGEEATVEPLAAAA